MTARDFDDDGLFIGENFSRIELLGKSITFPDYICSSGSPETEEVLIRGSYYYYICPYCKLTAPDDYFHIFKTLQYVMVTAKCCNHISFAAEKVHFWGKEFVEWIISLGAMVVSTVCEDSQRFLALENCKQEANNLLSLAYKPRLCQNPTPCSQGRFIGVLFSSTCMESSNKWMN